ncbi:hypothetical protein I9W82_001984 [Candida metapsilosis]|uniref:Hap4 transcription factor heteromerisation domain-containing protein n=1 Tax=Candida metapsilosis TaxID=273372 RepID=A0A8H7ZHB1_9ASCO|nr:hypothetical protein I9W82_001984 [Candida metapsilosis]
MSTAPILNQQAPVDTASLQMNNTTMPQSANENENVLQDSPATVKTSKDWVLPPRPKPGRKLKEMKPKKKCNKKPSSTLDTIPTIKRCAATPATRRQKKNDCCANDLNSDLSTVSSLLQNISIIDSENSCLKSNLLCLIHEYKHLKSLVLNSSTAEVSEQGKSNVNATTTNTELSNDSLLHDIAEIVDSAPHDVRAVHKRSFVEVCEEEGSSEIKHIVEEGEPLRRLSTPASRNSITSTTISSPVATAMGYNSTVDTVASTPLPSTIEFEQFINIHEPDNTSNASDEANVQSSSTSTYRSKKFAHYKDFHKLDTEEDSDGEINFEDDDLINGGGGEDEEDDFLGELCTPSSSLSHDLSRTTSPYSDYETNSLMSTLTRTTTGSSINTMLHEKPSFTTSDKLHSSCGYTSIHPPPLTLKKMGNFFDLPKYQENDKLYSFKFDTAEYQAKRIDDEYNLVTDFLEEKLMINEINYYSQQQQQ